jgi:dihydroorotate dehydrogenase electron transfer subunit
MSYKCGQFKITQKSVIANGIISLQVLCPEIAQLAVPGQFVQIKVDNHFLRRPISICEIDKQKGTLRLVFEIRGEGTAELAKLQENEMIDILAPLGIGFTMLDRGKKIIVIGGGIGVPPMLEVAKHYSQNATAIVGFRNCDTSILVDDFKKYGATTFLCTDDGSAGIHGFVTTALKQCLEKEKPDMVYACGPNGMLKGIIALVDEYDVPCEVSLEQRMACGVGACLACACKTVIGGKEHTLQVCKHGPVFSSKKVVLD